MSDQPSLGYLFVPSPLWIFDRFENGELSQQRFVILACLFRLADRRRLMWKRPTPKVALDEIRNATRYAGKAESLRRELGRMRDDGLLDYDVSGNPTGGYVYAFTLVRDDPFSSDQRPRSQTGSESQIEATEDEADSDARPRSPSARPLSSEAATPLVDSDCDEEVEPARPRSLDVGEETNPSLRAAVNQRSLSRERARETQQVNEKQLASDLRESLTGIENPTFRALLESTAKMLEPEAETPA